MRVLCFGLLLHLVVAQTGFGTSYLKNSRLCRQWNCLNEKLGLSDALPPKDRYAAALKSLLPEGPWQDAIAPTLDVCYGARPRRYTNTCPGQALMQCAVEQLIQNCPESSYRKEDACAPVSTLAGFKYLFSQGRYNDLEKNLPIERRPSWFLTNYFNSKCCDLPVFFNASVMKECGVDTFMHYYIHSPQQGKFLSISTLQAQTTTEATGKDVLKIVNITSKLPEDLQDPLDCCDLNDFIQSSWRTECDFYLSWNSQQRLMIKDQGHTYTTAAPTTTTRIPATIRSVKHNDVKIIPQSCEQESCIFQKLNIVSDSGVVDKDAFSKLLDNMTTVHAAWVKAKARVVTKCLSRPITDYEADCEINKVLACTFDVLSENCPYAKKADPCKHSSVLREDMSCQISSSKYRPKNRRQFCGVPNLVRHEVVAQCGAKSVTRMEYVADPPAIPKPKRHTWLTPKTTCKETTESTQCIMRKMEVLNKYGFLDYFKMKERIRHFADSSDEWTPLKNAYMTAFLATPAFYRDHCNSPKKFLNVLDTMLMTCPASRRKNTPQCNKLFSQVVTTPFDAQQNITKERVNQIIQYLQKVFLQKSPKMQYNHMLLPKLNMDGPNVPVSSPKTKIDETYPKPFAYGMLNSKSAPSVKEVKIKPAVMYKKPLVLLPVYRRLSNGKPGRQSFALRPYRDGIFRSTPFMIHSMGMSANGMK